MDGAWSREQFASQIARFPEGQICIEDNGKVVAATISLIVDYGRHGDRHTYNQIIGDGYLTTHDPNGDTLVRRGCLRPSRLSRHAARSAAVRRPQGTVRSSTCAPSSSAAGSPVTASTPTT